MLATTFKKGSNTPSLIVILLTLLSVIVAPVADAKIVINTIEPTASVSDNGRKIVLTGPIQTDVVEKIYLRVTVTQRTTGL